MNAINLIKYLRKILVSKLLLKCILLLMIVKKCLRINKELVSKCIFRKDRKYSFLTFINTRVGVFETGRRSRHFFGLHFYRTGPPTLIHKSANPKINI